MAVSIQGRVQIPSLTEADIDDNKSDVVVVGGGPVGLWTAIQTKILSGKEVTVIEKYEEYQRNIRLNIDAHSLKGIPDNNFLKELTKAWGNRSVSIQDMENGLVQLANEVGVKIIRGHSADPQDLHELFPEASVFIGADGARSKVREEIFQNEFRFNSNLQYMVQVQYEIEGDCWREMVGDNSIEKVRDLSDKYRRQKFAEHVVVENIRPQENGNSQVTLQIFIDKKTYDQMKDASFKHPYYFEMDLHKVPEELKNVLIKWWGARSKIHHETIQRGHTNKMTVVALNSYAAKNVVVDRDGRVWTLVGDAAGAFPFFRAINTGLGLGTMLAKAISSSFQKCDATGKKMTAASLRSYSRYATFRLNTERMKAYFKSLFLNITKVFLSISNRVFWQVNKIKPARQTVIEQEGNRIWDLLSSNEPLAQSN
ncbi:MAG: hypothetical protein COT84_07875 [Chlamydiae bacterium CG10_big_fil_rev_8_21_14_0_10_35_9]|nr:MAG: hypothetical protein COT84_07875 [Chlamydiae bacterium CG10_big_fil_rev_8_21_14_0_10_35_9]